MLLLDKTRARLLLALLESCQLIDVLRVHTPMLTAHTLPLNLQLFSFHSPFGSLKKFRLKLLPIPAPVLALQFYMTD